MLDSVRGELKSRDVSQAESITSDGEIARSWVYWSVGVGLVLGGLLMLIAEVFPLPHHVHHLDITDAFNIAWKIALLPPGVITARIAIDRINLSKKEHQHAVEVARSEEFDATQRRITELSAKASEQLSSDKAPVRIGGLTDLERLGQSNTELRQMVIDRICSYLQMPYAIPSPQEDATESRQERQVRLTAQRILVRHTRWPKEDMEPPRAFWPGISLSLSDASLIDLDMSDCRVSGVDFARATFNGSTVFRRVRIDDDANFAGANFRYSAFNEALFGGIATFDGTQFEGNTYFNGATFDRYAHFEEARFIANANFGGITFSANARFAGTTFTGYVGFSDSNFGESAYFSDARFNGDAHFKGATFGDKANFGDATFFKMVNFKGASFCGTAEFGGATFAGKVIFEGARFGEYILLGNSAFNGIKRVLDPDVTRLTVDPDGHVLTLTAPG